MRPELFEPQELSHEVIIDVLGLVGSKVTLAAIQNWTRFELLLAYDWAMRRYLRASDSLVRRRPKPSFVITAEKSSEAVNDFEMHVFIVQEVIFADYDYGNGEIYLITTSRDDAKCEAGRHPADAVEITEGDLRWGVAHGIAR